MTRSMLLPLCLLALARPVSAQGPDTVRLPVVIRQAEARDPRQAQHDLLRRQSDLRLANLRTTRFPAFSLESTGQHQSDVTTFPFRTVGSDDPPAPPHTTFDASLYLRQSVFDPALGARKDLERAQLSESQTRVTAALFSLRAEAIDAFFSAALLQSREAEVRATLADLEKRFEETRIRVRERASLPSEASTIEVAMLQRRQDLAEVAAARRAALAILGSLTGDSVRFNAMLALPDVNAQFESVRERVAAMIARPELAQFAAAQTRLQRQSELLDAEEKPRVNAYARTGYGKPGLNQLSHDFNTFWLAGVMVQWAPWNWERTNRERAALELQRAAITAEQQAFVLGLQRAVERDLATVDRLRAALALDDDIVALRERIEREARVRLDERVINTSEYVDRNTELLLARLARSRHRIELLQAQARFLNTLGLELR